MSATKYITVRFEVAETVDKEQFIEAVTCLVHGTEMDGNDPTVVFCESVIDVQDADDLIEE